MGDRVFGVVLALAAGVALLLYKLWFDALTRAAIAPTFFEERIGGRGL